MFQILREMGAKLKLHVEGLPNLVMTFEHPTQALKVEQITVYIALVNAECCSQQ